MNNKKVFMTITIVYMFMLSSCCGIFYYAGDKNGKLFAIKSFQNHAVSQNAGKYYIVNNEKQFLWLVDMPNLENIK